MSTSVTDHATSPSLVDAIRGGVRVFDLGRPLKVGMAQSPNHPAYWHAHPRRHGDMVRSDGGSAANDMISMGTHVGTHIDALSHVSQDGKLHGGVDVSDALEGGRYVQLGVHTVAPMFRRGVLLDVAATHGVAHLPGGYEITVDDLEGTLARQQTRIEPGDVVLVHSGWGRHFDAGDDTTFIGRDTGVPGVSAAGARWLADQAVHAVGADTIAFERLAPGAGHGLLPAHRVLLVEAGIYIVETLALTELAEAAVTEFAFVLSPLPLYGATGSPVRPIAVIGR